MVILTFRIEVFLQTSRKVVTFQPLRIILIFICTKQVFIIGRVICLVLQVVNLQPFVVCKTNTHMFSCISLGTGHLDVPKFYLPYLK